MATSERKVVGWDVGGAHVKACLLQRGEIIDVAQWACPLWQGMEKLAPVVQAARERWPGWGAAQHAVTMTGEMVDLFTDREDGVRRIAAELARLLTQPSTTTEGADPDAVHFFAGDAGWCRSAEVAAHWEAIASANWLATARHAALQFGDGLLADMGSTTTDLIAFKAGCVVSTGRTDAQRLASGELVYHGVVRTPLCALARRIAWRGTPHNVMNEFFATTADVYRLTGELDPAHDQHASADGAPKDTRATQQRLARMVGLDARDADDARWLSFACAWRAAQVAELGSQLRRVADDQGLPDDAVFVAAGCGAFLLPDVLQAAGRSAVGRCFDFGGDTVPLAADAAASVADWARVGAPSVALALLFAAQGVR